MKKLIAIAGVLILLFATSAFTVTSIDETNENNNKNNVVTLPLEERSLVLEMPKIIKQEADEVYLKVEIDASFSNGSWAEYVKKSVEYNVEELLDAGVSGTCKVSFVISNDGTVKDVKVLSMQNSRLAEIVIGAIKKAPKWLPAQQNGISVNSKREQEITFLIK